MVPTDKFTVLSRKVNGTLLVVKISPLSSRNIRVVRAVGEAKLAKFSSSQ